MLTHLFGLFLSLTFPLLAQSTNSEKRPDFSQAQFCLNEDLLDDLAGAHAQDPAAYLFAVKTDQRKASRIVVSKKRRKLYLISRQQKVLGIYPVAFGFGAFNGAKAFEGDGKTPEGVYFISKKTTTTSYHRALHVSYPNSHDKKFAAHFGKSPGGLILIHGFPTRIIDGLTPEWVSQVHPETDWTQGCIAVTNSEIEEIYSRVEEKTKIEICSL